MRAYTSIPMERKLDKIERIPFSGCWFWMGSTDKDGYGRMAGSSNGVRWFQFAHRASYEFHIGPIPEDMHICHHCDVPCCINPYHLYVGDPATNGNDKKVRGRARTTPQPGALNGMFGRVGPLNPMYGKKHTDEARLKISLAKLK